MCGGAGFTLAPGVDKYWAVVFVAHAVFGALEWTRYRNFLEKGEVQHCLRTPIAHGSLLLDKNTHKDGSCINGRHCILQAYLHGVEAVRILL